MATVNCAPSTSRLMINPPMLSKTNELLNVSSSDNFRNYLSSNHPAIEPAVESVIKPVYHSTDSDSLYSFDNGNLSGINNDNMDNFSENRVFCYICCKYLNYDHDCTEYNPTMATCMVPNCNVVSKLFKDILPHYYNHAVESSRTQLSRLCFPSYKRNETRTYNLKICGLRNIMHRTLKCYECNITFKTMREFTQHKLQNHDCIIRHNTGKYICIHCGISSVEMSFFETHLNVCVKRLFVKRKIKEYNTNNQQSELNNTTNSSRGTKRSKNQIVKLETKKEKIGIFKNDMLFTCLNPSCKLIFTSYNTFKNHYRQHFNIEKNSSMCWQCFTPFNRICDLRTHKASNYFCYNHDLFKCQECSEEHDDLETLSVHKFIVHDGELINYKHRIYIGCKYCKTQVIVTDLKNHLTNCYMCNE